MRIIIDLQKAQIDFTLKNIENASLLLSKEIVFNNSHHEIVLALSGHFPESITPIREVFDHLLSQKNIRVWNSPSPVNNCDPSNKWRREIAEHIREAFFKHIRPDVIFIPSFSVGYTDESVMSVGNFTPDAKTIVSLNRDDITLIDNTDSRYESYRLDYVKQLNLADLIWVVPPLSMNEASKHFNISSERIKTRLIDGENIYHETALHLLKLFENIKSKTLTSNILPLKNRLKLAFISPFPPERSGIADYSAELLPELNKFYDIDAIVDESELLSIGQFENCGVKSSEWFSKYSFLYDRVIYHIGNSRFHKYMFNLLYEVPGMVVLHDFFLGDIHNYLETHNISSFAFTRALYNSHGYGALVEHFQAKQISETIRKYPINLNVLQNAKSIIVHSNHSRALADQWYGQGFSSNWNVIPLLRKQNTEIDKVHARSILALNPNDFILCSFGLLGSTKLNHRLLDAWINSRLADDPRCLLIFVGEEQPGEYCNQLRTKIQAYNLDKRIIITGWVEMPIFRNYLAAADMAVQLRAFSRGETSAAILDCMNYSLPTIVNAHGSLAELSTDAVWMLPDEFTDTQLTDAIEALWQDENKRTSYGESARKVILQNHSPQHCAEQYVLAIEDGYSSSRNCTDRLINDIARVKGLQLTDLDLLMLAQSISQATPTETITRQIMVDVSATSSNDLKTGIQRVVRAIVSELIKSPPQGYRIEPVYLSNKGGVWHYRYARKWTIKNLGGFNGWIVDEPVEMIAGDVLLIADFTSMLIVEAERSGLLNRIKNEGVKIHFIVYDLLPLQMPDFFPPGQFGFLEWLDVVIKFADGTFCISQTVSEDLKMWIENVTPIRTNMLIDWFHLGADIKNSIPTGGYQKNAEQLSSKIMISQTFLMVGTIEPRKGYLQTLRAFSILWQQGYNIILIIVGKEGWEKLPDSSRRTIPEIINQIRNHSELGKRLFWLKGISDEYLEKLYSISTCLIEASEGEGFGLPIIEAAKHNLPIIARDIAVFREVAGVNAYYFEGLEPLELSETIVDWLKLKKNNKVPLSNSLQWLTWKESISILINKMKLR